MTNRTDLSDEEARRLKRALDAGGKLRLQDGDAVDDAILHLVALEMLCPLTAIGDDAVLFGITPAGQRAVTVV